MIRIDLNNPQPLEEQISAALRQALAQGAVRPGDELPSVRQVAGDLGVHWNTVARAYRRLADEGLLSVRRGKGVVARERVRSTARVSRTTVQERFAATVADALLGGLSHDDISHAFREALAGFGDRKR